MGPGELRGAVLTRQLMERDAALDDGWRLFRKRQFVLLMWPMVKQEGCQILVRALGSTCNRGQLRKIVVVDLELRPTCRSYSDIAALAPAFASVHAERDKGINRKGRPGGRSLDCEKYGMLGGALDWRSVIIYFYTGIIGPLAFSYTTNPVKRHRHA